MCITWQQPQNFNEEHLPEPGRYLATARRERGSSINKIVMDCHPGITSEKS